jgi:hypothetical protein
MIFQGCYNELRNDFKIPCGRSFQKDEPLPTVNYKYEKRQKELEKKKKKAEKTRLKEIKKTIKPEEKPVPSSEQ